MYRFETTPRFDKEFKRLDPYIQKMIKAWIQKNLIDSNNPRNHGKALVGKYKGQWRYRVGDYRLICEIEDDRLVIMALTVGHRSSVYLHELEEIEYGQD